MRHPKVGKGYVWAWRACISSTDGQTQAQLLGTSSGSLGLRQEGVLEKHRWPRQASGGWGVILLLAVGANRKKAPALTWRLTEAKSGTAQFKGMSEFSIHWILPASWIVYDLFLLLQPLLGCIISDSLGLINRQSWPMSIIPFSLFKKSTCYLLGAHAPLLGVCVCVCWGRSSSHKSAFAGHHPHCLRHQCILQWSLWSR